jgi:diguanylate cyclase (GGDEF)-like protein
MHVPHLALLALEAAVMSVIILSLFRARTLLGLTPLYIVLGGFQFLEATLSMKVEIAPGVQLNPGSTILFTATLFTVLLIYVKEDAIEARKLVYGLVLANAAVAIISLLIGWQLSIPPSSSTGMDRHDFLASSSIAVGGTTLLLIDVIGIILLYEFISKVIGRPFVRFYLSLVAIVAFDNAIFTTVFQYGRPNLLWIIATGFVGKALAALFYTIVCWTYLRFVEPQTAVVGTGDVSDVFQALTYRQKYEQVRQRMVRDALTGLFNRGYFDEALPQALAHAKRSGEPLSLILIDTDQFKSINDTFSHMEGDRVLRLIGTTLNDQARAADVPCRYGGDEFAVLLSLGDAQAASAFAERFRATLQERCRTAEQPCPWGRVTTTIGIATYPADGDDMTADDLVRLADRRLYAGKHAGRDQVVAVPA